MPATCEVQLDGTAPWLAALGESLLSADAWAEGVLELSADGRPISPYPEGLGGVRISLLGGGAEAPAGRVAMDIEGPWLTWRGDREALGNLGRSLLNVFAPGVTPGAHLHLDCIEGEQLMAPTQWFLVVKLVAN